MAGPLDEYKIAGENLRWYSHIRFAQLTLFTALTAAIFTLAFSQSLAEFPAMRVLLKAGGAMLALAYWILESRADAYWSHYMARAEALERKLKFQLYTTRPKHLLRTTNVIRGVLFVIALFWFASLWIT